MDDPREAQEAIYGAEGGPPMLYESPRSKPPPRSGKRRKLVPPNPPTEELVRKIQEQTRVLLVDETKLSPGDLPGDFPKELAFRALAAYSLLRTLSVTLRLSPFTPTVFLRALYLPYPNKLIGQVHVALLRILLPHLGYSYKASGRSSHKRRTIDNIRWPLRAGDNLTYLDGNCWPLFYDDYCHLTADILWASYNDTKNYVDMRCVDCMAVGLEEYQYSNGINDDGDESINDIQSTSSDEERGNPSLTQGPLPSSGPVSPLKRSQRAGRDKAYGGFDQSDTDSEFGDNDAVEDVDTDVEYTRRNSKQNNRKRKALPRQVQGKQLNVADDKDDHKERTEKLNDQSFESLPAPQLPNSLDSFGVVVDEGKTSSSQTNDANLLGVNRKMDESTLMTENKLSQDEPRGASVMHIRGGGGGLDPMKSSFPAVASRFVAENKITPSILTGESREVEVKTGNAVSSPIYRHNRRTLPLKKKDPAVSSYASAGPRPSLSLSDDQSKIYQLGTRSSQPTVNGAVIGNQNLSQQDLRFKDMRMNGRKSSLSGIDPWAYHQFPYQQGVLSQGRSGGEMAPFSAKPRRKALEVEDDVAKTLRDVICGNLLQPLEIPTTENVNSTKNNPTEFEQRVEKEKWVHFEPLYKLRSGVPYHRLSLEHKLVILEFLIDQLLSGGDVVEELERRRAVEDGCTVPYGVWPMDEEFENLDNGDDCGVCTGEGELLCCDGCVRSYHRECIDMSATEQVPDGKWLCPECRLVDPALLGPLTAGAKSSLDWFSVADIQTSLREAELRRKRHQQVGNRDVYGLVEFPWNSLGDSQAQTTMAEANRPETAGLQPVFAASNPFPNQEFLIVHGYVFNRSANCPESSSSVELMSRNLVLDTLGKLDPTIKKAWPLVQVPTHETLATPHFRTSRWYMMPFDSYDPSFYTSKYLKAPVPPLIRIVERSNVRQTVMDYESECYQNSTRRLSGALSRDLTFDASISKSLLSEPFLYDPYFLFREYLTRLEGQVRKACLVDSMWEAGTDRTLQEKWLKSVRAAKSINRLARLLLQLIDRVHLRAFRDGWFQNHHLKGDQVAADTSRHFADLPSDWSAEKERQKRIWEKIAPDAILHVCESQGCSLHPFVQGIKEDISPSLVVKRSKRKRAKFSVTVPPSELENSTVVPTLQDSVETSKESTPMEFLAKPLASLKAFGVDQRHGDVPRPISIPSGELVWNQANSEGDATMHTLASQRTTNRVLGESKALDDGVIATGGQLRPGTFMPQETSWEASDGAPRAKGSEIKSSDHASVPGISNDSVVSGSQVTSCDGMSKVVIVESQENSTEGNAEQSKSSSRKLLKRSRSGAPAPIRTSTRRSGVRMAIASADHEVKDEGPPMEGLVHERLPASPDSIDMQIDLNKMMKVTKVEKIIKGSFQNQLVWPIAGRIPFPTVGNLPPNEMQRLGRNAGVVRVPFVAYETAHEVGQVCFAHTWRQETEKCTAYEELALQIRVFESFLDYQTIHSCESVARRGKNQIQKFIKLSQRDPSNGIVEHFVMSKTKMRGCWISSEHIDVSTLVLDTYTRRQHYINKRSEYLKAKAKGETIRKEREEAVRRVQDKEERRPNAPKAEGTRGAIVPALPNQGNHQASGSNLDMVSQPEMTHDARRWTEISNAIVKQHQAEFVTLARQCSNAGLAIPEHRLNELRNSTLLNLKGIGYLEVPEDKLVQIILSSEGESQHEMNQYRPPTNDLQLLNANAIPSALNAWTNSGGINQFGDNLGAFDQQRTQSTAVASNFGNMGALQPPGTSRPAQFSTPSSSANVLVSALGRTLMDRNMGPMPPTGLNQFGDNSGAFDQQRTQPTAVASNFWNMGASQSTGTSRPAQFSAPSSSANGLLSALGQTLMDRNMGHMPQEGSIPGMPHPQQDYYASMGGIAQQYPQHAQQPHQFPFEQQYPSYPHQQQPQFNQFWGGLGNAQDMDSLLRMARGQMGQQPFWGHNQVPVTDEQQVQLQLLQHFQLQEQQRQQHQQQQQQQRQQQQRQQHQNSQFRGPSFPDYNGFW